MSFHAIARAIRPPSSGNAGIRLNSEQQHVDRREVAEHRGGGAGRRPRRTARCWSASDPLDTAMPNPKQTAAISRVTSGPAAATRNSTPGESASLAELRHAAEQPQVDALDRDAVADRHPRVPQLVQQDREEEQQRADHGQDERVRARRDVLVVAGQRPDDQEQDEEPAVVDAYADPEDAGQLDRAATEHCWDGVRNGVAYRGALASKWWTAWTRLTLPCRS